MVATAALPGEQIIGAAGKSQAALAVGGRQGCIAPSVLAERCKIDDAGAEGSGGEKGASDG